MYAPLGAALKLMAALCQQAGQQDVCTTQLCPAVSTMQLQSNSEVASQLLSAVTGAAREMANISLRSLLSFCLQYVVFSLLIANKISHRSYFQMNTDKYKFDGSAF